MATLENTKWQPCREPLRFTLARTGAIALIIGVVIAWSTGRPRNWWTAAVLAFWPAFGGHWVEIAFLNWLRPRLSADRITQIIARLAVWFVGGIALTLGMKWTATLLPGFHRLRWHAPWIGGLGFIALELLVHLVLWLRGRPNFYDGRG
jgi:hypothetical protein